MRQLGFFFCLGEATRSFFLGGAARFFRRVGSFRKERKNLEGEEI